jgi:hypothetical protein
LTTAAWKRAFFIGICPVPKPPIGDQVVVARAHKVAIK